MKFLGIDYGQKRTGIAVTDEGGRMAFARTALTMAGRERFWAELLALLREEAPAALVVGLPVRQDGSDSLTTRQVRNFVAGLKRRVELPVYLMPEQYSSFEAEGLLREAGKTGRAAQAGLDAAAAARILESFLNCDAARRVRA
jgi:putative Holliday junction resolvase